MLYNKGAVRISGVAGSRTSKIGSGAGGIGGMDVASITECYNKGKVAANVKTGTATIRVKFLRQQRPAVI